jgi:hypothetical protein
MAQRTGLQSEVLSVVNFSGGPNRPLRFFVSPYPLNKTLHRIWERHTAQFVTPGCFECFSQLFIFCAHLLESLKEGTDMGFFSFETAWRTLQGFEIMNMLRKEQVQGVATGEVSDQVTAIATLFGVAV